VKADPTERFAYLLYEAAISTGLEGRFDWSEVRQTYLDFTNAIIARLIPESTSVRSPDALSPGLSHHPQSDPHPDRG
jgi:hypothetical protein